MAAAIKSDALLDRKSSTRGLERLIAAD